MAFGKRRRSIKENRDKECIKNTLFNKRTWRNWQTRRFQVPVGNRVGSNPVVRTKKENTKTVFSFLVFTEYTKGFEWGAVLREQNALPYGVCMTINYEGKGRRW